MDTNKQLPAGLDYQGRHQTAADLRERIEERDEVNRAALSARLRAARDDEHARPPMTRRDVCCLVAVISTSALISLAVLYGLRELAGVLLP